MYIFKWRSLIFLSVFCLLGCGKGAPSLDNFDSSVWKSDRYACRGERSRLYASLSLQKSKLLGLNEMEVVETLGKPDQNELSKRNQKFYYYFLSASTKCASPDPKARRLVLRFNATGLVKEVGEE